MKMKITILNKLIKELSGSALNLLIYLIQRQENATAIVQDVHYKDACAMCEFKSTKTFYKALKELDKKGFIQYSQSSNSTYQVQVLDNKFRSAQDFSAYLNLNYRLFHTALFMSLDKHMKKFLLRVFSLKDAKDKGLDFTIDTMKRYKMLNRIEDLQMFLSIKFHEGKFFFNVISELTSKDKFELNTHLEHKLKGICRRYKLSFDRKSFQDMIEMFAVYTTEAKRGSSAFIRRYMEALLICKQYGKLVPALVRDFVLQGNTKTNEYKKTDSTMKASEGDAWDIPVEPSHFVDEVHGFNFEGMFKADPVWADQFEPVFD